MNPCFNIKVMPRSLVKFQACPRQTNLILSQKEGFTMNWHSCKLCGCFWTFWTKVILGCYWVSSFIPSFIFRFFYHFIGSSRYNICWQFSLRKKECQHWGRGCHKNPEKGFNIFFGWSHSAKSTINTPLHTLNSKGLIK